MGGLAAAWGVRDAEGLVRSLWQDWQRCADGLWAADKLGGSGRMSKRDAPEASGAPDSESKKRSCRAAKMKVCASRPECGIACVRRQRCLARGV